MRLCNLLVCAGLAVTGARPALATIYNPVTDFSANNNPNGVWSYRQGNMTLLGTKAVPVGNLPQWNNAVGYPGGSYITDNNTATSYQSGTVYFRANDLTIDGQAAGVDVRFTALSAGSYNVTGAFQANDTSPHPHAVQIVLNGVTSEFSATSPGSYTAPGDTFSFVVSLAAADYLDFSSTSPGDGSYQSTGLSLTITSGASAAVPEPAPMAVLGIGVLGLIGCQRLRRSGGAVE